jgi:hypothetical protein
VVEDCVVVGSDVEVGDCVVVGSDVEEGDGLMRRDVAVRRVGFKRARAALLIALASS